MAKVVARSGETLDELLRRFKKQVNNAEIIQTYKRHDFFLKKSLRRKEKSKLARIKNRRK